MTTKPRHGARSSSKPGLPEGSPEPQNLEDARGQGDAPDWAGQPGTDIAEGQVLDGTIMAARRAAEYVLARKYGPATRDLVGYIAERSIDTSDLNAVILEQMALRLAAASEASEILDPFGTVKGKDMLGKALWVTGAEFMESDLEEGFPWYVSLSVLDRATGKHTVVTVGGEKLVLQAAEMDRKDLWPQAVAIHEADRATKAGFYPLELRAA